MSHAAHNGGNAVSRRAFLAAGLGAAVASSRDSSAAFAAERTMETPLHYRSLVEVAKGIRDGDLSPVALTKTMLARIEALEPRLHAYYTLSPERALAAAEKAQREIAGGRYLGPLRRADRGQGPLLHRRRPHHRRLRRAPRLRADVRCHGGAPPRGRWRRPARQAGDHRGRHGRIQPRVRGTAQSVG